MCDVCKQSKLIIGDLNLDFARVADQKKLTDICGGKRDRILKELKTDQHSQLDHILLDTTIWQEHFSTSYYNYTTDHKAVTLRLPKLFTNNKISKQFKQRLHFDQLKKTIIGLRRKAESCNQSPKRQKPGVTSRKRFNDDNTGKLLRMDNAHQPHKPDDKLAVPIFRMKKTFRHNDGNTTWLRQQFPLTLCFAVTAHKVSYNNSKLYHFCIKKKISEPGTNIERSAY